MPPPARHLPRRPGHPYPAITTPTMSERAEQIGQDDRAIADKALAESRSTRRRILPAADLGIASITSVSGVPQPAVAGLDAEPGRDDRGEPVGQERREVIRIHGYDSAPRAQAPHVAGPRPRYQPEHRCHQRQERRESPARRSTRDCHSYGWVVYARRAGRSPVAACVMNRGGRGLFRHDLAFPGGCIGRPPGEAVGMTTDRRQRLRRVRLVVCPGRAARIRR